jgi:hypothetical protein
MRSLLSPRRRRDKQKEIHPHAGNIHWVHYKAWRNSGVAFEFGDEVYTAPNRSLASFVLVCVCVCVAAARAGGRAMAWGEPLTRMLPRHRVRSVA